MDPIIELLLLFLLVAFALFFMINYACVINKFFVIRDIKKRVDQDSLYMYDTELKWYMWLPFVYMVHDIIEEIKMQRWVNNLKR